MPCRDYQADAEIHEVAGVRLDDYAKKLCEAMGIIETAGLLKRTSPALRAWWWAHKEDDRREQERKTKRLRELRDKQSALSRLTPRERKLLGV